MSFLDLDEFLIDLSTKVELVYTPLVDAKRYPEGVDVALVEGSICNTDHVELIQTIRRNTRVVVAFGDCAVTGNVTAMRNPLGSAQPVLERSYLDPHNLNPRIPDEAGIVPGLLREAWPIHRVIEVDAYLPGCPPPADRIKAVLVQLLEGKTVELTGKDLRFG
jgi:NAD-reducing hydrogenase small subunit